MGADPKEFSKVNPLVFQHNETGKLYIEVPEGWAELLDNPVATNVTAFAAIDDVPMPAQLVLNVYATRAQYWEAECEALKTQLADAKETIQRMGV